MNRLARSVIIVLSVAIAATLAYVYYRHAERYPSTDDAYVDAEVVGVVAQVAGPIVQLPIEDNQPVRAGDLLFEIDPRPFEIAVAGARAALDKTGQNVSALAEQVARISGSRRPSGSASSLSRSWAPSRSRIGTRRRRGSTTLARSWPTRGPS